jgi:hypothetical protein
MHETRLRAVVQMSHLPPKHALHVQGKTHDITVQATAQTSPAGLMPK